MTPSTHNLRQALMGAVLAFGASGAAMAQGACVKFFNAASTQELSVFNSCGECRIAIVSRTQAFGQTSSTAGRRNYQTEHRVPAYGSVRIEMSKPTMELLGDRPCGNVIGR